MTSARLRLQGLTIGLWGRHELYVMSLAALLSQRGANVRVLEDPATVLGDPPDRRLDIVLLESPFRSELSPLAGGDAPPVIVLVERSSPPDAAVVPRFVHAVVEKSTSLANLSRVIGEALERRQSAPVELTARQREVLKLIAEGLDNAQIAARLGISPRTARAHVSGVLERLGVENRTQAAVTAVRRGWVGK
jgi:DNA-binding NarL/FixJ family response regulator